MQTKLVQTAPPLSQESGLPMNTIKFTADSAADQSPSGINMQVWRLRL